MTTTLIHSNVLAHALRPVQFNTRLSADPTKKLTELATANGLAAATYLRVILECAIQKELRFEQMDLLLASDRRERVDQQINTRLPVEKYQALHDLAEAQDIHVSIYARAIVNHAIRHRLMVQVAVVETGSEKAPAMEAA